MNIITWITILFALNILIFFSIISKILTNKKDYWKNIYEYEQELANIHKKYKGN